MVIRYSIQELNAIGEIVILKECISDARTTPNNEHANKLLKFMQECERQMNKCQQDTDVRLTSSVAEFFRRAQQNFYTSTSIDPTKIRRLSEIEADIIRDRTAY